MSHRRKKVLVTGAEGLLGSEMVTAGERGEWARWDDWAGIERLNIVGLGHHELDVTHEEEVRHRFADEAPDWVIHCAAYTAVDRAEDQPDEAMRVNHGATVHVAKAAAAFGAGMVYVSTDYVFDGRKRTPYLPDDAVGPMSVYGRTKLAGEEAALEAGALVVRTGWLYGAGGPNFVQAILERAERGESLRVVDDQRGRPTWARHVADAVLVLALREGERGIWHVADGGDATWLELAREVLEARGLDVEVEGVSSETWGAAAPRPAYSVLDLRRTERKLGRPMMSWRWALRRFLDTS